MKPCLVGDHALNFGLIRLVHHGFHIEMAFALGSFRSQDMALKSVSTLELARTCLLEALRRSTVCLQLRHSSLSSLQQKRRKRRGAQTGDLPLGYNLPRVISRWKEATATAPAPAVLPAALAV